MKRHLIIENEAEGIEGSNIFAREIAEQLGPEDTILFYGELGSGKTYLVKRIVANLGINANVTSPSFSIVNQYEGEILIYHIDLYRIKNKQDVINTGFEDILNSGAIIFIEWPQIVEDEFKWKHFRVYIETNPKNEFWRKLSFYKVN